MTLGLNSLANLTFCYYVILQFKKPRINLSIFHMLIV